MEIKNLLYPSVLGFPTMCCAFLHERNYIVIHRLILYSFTQSMKVYLCMRVVIHLTRLQVWQNLDFISKGFRFPFYWVEIVCLRCDVWQHWPTSNLSTCVTKGEEIAVIAYRDAGTHKSLGLSLSVTDTHFPLRLCGAWSTPELKPQLTCASQANVSLGLIFGMLN